MDCQSTRFTRGVMSVRIHRSQAASTAPSHSNSGLIVEPRFRLAPRSHFLRLLVLIVILLFLTAVKITSRIRIKIAGGIRNAALGSLCSCRFAAPFQRHRQSEDLPVFEDFSRGVVAAGTHYAPAGMRGGTAKIESFNRGSIVGVAGQRPHEGQTGE